MVSYRPHKRWKLQPLAIRYTLVAVLWILQALLLLTGRVRTTSLQSFLEARFSPLYALAHRWETQRQESHLKKMRLQELQIEVQELRKQMADLQIQQARNAPLLFESEDNARLLGLKRLIPLQTLSARVLLNLRNRPFGGLILDQGRDAGLEPDQGVIAPEGVVGRLWSVSATQSKVLPVDAPNASVAVLLSRSRATGVLQGAGNGTAEILYVGSQEVVQEGEAILTSGLDQVFPRGLFVGTVASLKPVGFELRIKVRLSAPMNRLTNVLILPKLPPIEAHPSMEPQAQGGRP